MFDYPTVADLTDFILSQFAPDDDADGAVLGCDLSAAREPLSMLGLAGRYPGMSAQTLRFEEIKTFCYCCDCGAYLFVFVFCCCCFQPIESFCG